MFDIGKIISVLPSGSKHNDDGDGMLKVKYVEDNSTSTVSLHLHNMNKKLGPFGHDVRIHIFLSNTIFSYSVHYFISDPGSFLYETVINN